MSDGFDAGFIAGFLTGALIGMLLMGVWIKYLDRNK